MGQSLKNGLGLGLGLGLGSYFAKYVTLDKKKVTLRNMGHNWQHESHMAKWVTAIRRDHTGYNRLHLAKWVTLRNKWVTLGKIAQS